MRSRPLKDRLPYEIVGPLERVDERDTVFARACLEDGSDREKEYHAIHPELKETDLRMAEFYLRNVTPSYESVFGPVASLALPDVVDGPVSARKISETPAEFASLVKQTALYLGADLVGVGRLNQAWVYSHRGRHPYFAGYTPNPPFFSGLPPGYTGAGWGDPIEIKHRNVISMAFAQSRRSLGDGISTQSDFEVGKVYGRSALVSVQLARLIRELGYSARAHHLRNYGIMVAPAAVDCGLGELGRCGYVVTRKYGANTRLACVSTDLPLDPDTPIELGMQDFCSKCLRCAKACPAGAIPFGERVVVRGIKKWEIDREKCFLFWGAKGHSCAVCQIVCPWSKPNTLMHTAVSRVAMSIPRSRPLIIWADSLLFPRP